MNNNHGWGLRAELGMCIVLIFFFCIALVLIQSTVNKMGLNVDFINYTSNNNLNY